MNDEAFCGPRFAGLLFVGMCVVLGLVHGCARHPRGGFLNKYDERLPGCSVAGPDDVWCRPAPSQSWDQENLKKNDHGCPTAVYVAPNGVLELCP
jgi:hypothetical protein